MKSLESTTIRVDLDVYNELKKHIQDFSDTPNVILRRILKLGVPANSEGSYLSSKRRGIHNRVEGDKQRRRLSELYGNKLNRYPILYSTEHLVSPNTTRYFFGIAKHKFEEQVNSRGYLLLICEKAETTFFIPATWISNHTPKPLPQYLKINILLEDGKYFWQNKKDGILINEFKK